MAMRPVAGSLRFFIATAPCFTRAALAGFACPIAGGGDVAM